jgi:hypothetical protein
MAALSKVAWITRAELEHKALTLGLYGHAATEDELKRSIASIWAISDAIVVPKLLPESKLEAHRG